MSQSNATFAVVYSPTAVSHFDINMNKGKKAYSGVVECETLTSSEYFQCDAESLKPENRDALVKVYKFDALNFKGNSTVERRIGVEYDSYSDTCRYTYNVVNERDPKVPSVRVYGDKAVYSDITPCDNPKLSDLKLLPEVLIIDDLDKSPFDYCDPSKLKCIVHRVSYTPIGKLNKYLEELSRKEGRDVFKNLVALELIDILVQRFLEYFDIKKLNILNLEYTTGGETFDRSSITIGKSEFVFASDRHLSYREVRLADMYYHKIKTGSVANIGFIDARLYGRDEGLQIISSIKHEFSESTVRINIAPVPYSRQKSAKVVR